MVQDRRPEADWTEVGPRLVRPIFWDRRSRFGPIDRPSVGLWTSLRERESARASERMNRRMRTRERTREKEQFGDDLEREQDISTEQARVEERTDRT